MKTRVQLIAWILLFICVGCDSNEPLPLEEIPEIGITINDLNKDIRIFAPNGWNTFKIGDPLGLAVEVVSENQIIFAPDYGSRIYLREKDHWVKVKNLVNYPPGYIILSPSNNDKTMQGDAVIYPELFDNNNAQTLRIFLIGNIYRNESRTEEKTASYIDVTLKP